MLPDGANKALMASLVTAVLGWIGQSMALVGRVDALEAGQARIEMRLDSVLVKLERPQLVARADTDPAAAAHPPELPARHDRPKRRPTP